MIGASNQIKRIAIKMANNNRVFPIRSCPAVGTAKTKRTILMQINLVAQCNRDFVFILR